MRVSRRLKALLGGVVFAGVLYAILAAPGFLSDSVPMVPARHHAAMVRR